MSAATRPNIIFFIADQLRADHLGFAGNPVVKTPHLDRVAREGLWFTQATVTNPTCMPSRASLLTGQWPSAHGTRCNGITLNPNATTFVRELRGAGYATCAIGKLHHQNMGWPYEDDQQREIDAVDPLLMDPTRRDAVEVEREPGWDEFENRERHEAAFVHMPADYYGYDRVDLVVGHGDRPGGHYFHWALDKGYDPRELGGAEHAKSRFDAWEQVYETSIPLEAHPSVYVAERAMARIDECAENDEPFFLFVSFPDPHHPFAPPSEYAHLYDPSEIPLPRGFSADHPDLPAHIQRLVDQRGVPGDDPTMTWSVTTEQYQHAAAAQYGLITLMDDQIGRVLGRLAERGLDENTIVIMASDHGDLMGDHGLMLKHFSHYRALTNVPLVVRVPPALLAGAGSGGAGGPDAPVAESAGSGAAAGSGGTGVPTSDALVCLADLAPTLLELTGVELFRGIQGRSLVPLLRGEGNENAAPRDAIVIEEDQPFGLPGLPGPVRMRTLLTSEARLTRYFGTDMVELYDLREDPDELRNVAYQARYAELLQRMSERMLAEMVALTVMGTRPTASA
ncbi:sulfatase-like hydrolase/transferase [Micrococcales bacterium 31B]|nr:sulfatase-like hydrolase/transferase [Micrococcales bacterium 31B]